MRKTYGSEAFDRSVLSVDESVVVFLTKLSTSDEITAVTWTSGTLLDVIKRESDDSCFLLMDLLFHLSEQLTANHTLANRTKIGIANNAPIVELVLSDASTTGIMWLFSSIQNVTEIYKYNEEYKVYQDKLCNTHFNVDATEEMISRRLLGSRVES